MLTWVLALIAIWFALNLLRVLVLGMRRSREQPNGGETVDTGSP